MQPRATVLATVCFMLSPVRLSAVCL